MAKGVEIPKMDMSILEGKEKIKEEKKAEAWQENQKEKAMTPDELFDYRQEKSKQKWAGVRETAGKVFSKIGELGGKALKFLTRGWVLRDRYAKQGAEAAGKFAKEDWEKTKGHVDAAGQFVKKDWDKTTQGWKEAVPRAGKEIVSGAKIAGTIIAAPVVLPIIAGIEGGKAISRGAVELTKKIDVWDQEMTQKCREILDAGVEKKNQIIAGLKNGFAKWKNKWEQYLVGREKVKLARKEKWAGFKLKLWETVGNIGKALSKGAELSTGKVLDYNAEVKQNQEKLNLRMADLKGKYEEIGKAPATA